MSENLKRHAPDIKVLGEGRAIAFMPESPMGVWVHIQDVEDLLDVKDKEIAKLKERSQWYRQKDKDIYFECGKHWGAEYIIKMKDGTTHLAYGGCDEGDDGSVSTYLQFQDDDYEWEYDDIDIWYEIPDHRIIGNIKESDK